MPKSSRILWFTMTNSIGTSCSQRESHSGWVARCWLLPSPTGQHRHDMQWAAPRGLDHIDRHIDVAAYGFGIRTRLVRGIHEGPSRFAL
jgi:hypothetical protein